MELLCDMPRPPVPVLRVPQAAQRIDGKHHPGRADVRLPCSAQATPQLKHGGMLVLNDCAVTTAPLTAIAASGAERQRGRVC